MLARLIAQGKSAVEVGAITGYTPARVRTLQTDPAFQELLSHYELQEVSANADITAQIRHLALSAASTLQERLEVEPEGFSNKELREIATAGFDRIGHGPSSKLDLNLNDPQHVIQGLKEALALESVGRVLSKSDPEILPTIDADFSPVEVPDG
jgi:hypothetical protein